MKGLSQDLSLHLMWQDIRLSFVAEGMSWRPDVAADMTNRMHEAWHNTLLELHRFGMLATGDDEDDDDTDEFGPTRSSELIDPFTYQVQDDQEGQDG
jgi:hypothetical protein